MTISAVITLRTCLCIPILLSTAICIIVTYLMVDKRRMLRDCFGILIAASVNIMFLIVMIRVCFDHPALRHLDTDSAALLVSVVACTSTFMSAILVTAIAAVVLAYRRRKRLLASAGKHCLESVTRY